MILFAQEYQALLQQMADARKAGDLETLARAERDLTDLIRAKNFKPVFDPKEAQLPRSDRS